jgi:hypothetical protein
VSVCGRSLVFLTIIELSFTLGAAADVPVPASCTPDVNARLAGLLSSHVRNNVDNVMVCGVTVSPSRPQPGGPHGTHEILPITVVFPDGSSRLVEVVTNDDLDGKVTASAKASVFAYGQAFFTSPGHFAAGIHDVHCSTHAGADNGWVVVNGTKYPAAACRVPSRQDSH